MHPHQLATLAVAAVATWAAFAGPVSDGHGVLADPSGRTLYVFDKDAPGKSNCRDVCLNMWPAFLAKAGAQPTGDFNLIDSEGGKQWTYRNRPLYFYAGDEQAGDRRGDRIGGVWHVIPAAQPRARTVEEGVTSSYGY